MTNVIMELQFLPANDAWAFTFGDELVPLDGFPRFFTSHGHAVAAAHKRGLVVYTNNVVVTDEQFKAVHSQPDHRLLMSVRSVRACSCGDQHYVPTEEY